MSSEHALSSSISFSLLPSCMELLISLAGKIITEGAFLSSAEVIICSLTGVTRHPWSFLPPVGCPPVPQLGIGGIKTGCLTHLFMPFFKKTTLLQASKPREGTDSLFTEQKASSCERNLPVLEINPNPDCLHSRAGSDSPDGKAGQIPKFSAGSPAYHLNPKLLFCREGGEQLQGLNQKRIRHRGRELIPQHKEHVGLCTR